MKHIHVLTEEVVEDDTGRTVEAATCKTCGRTDWEIEHGQVDMDKAKGAWKQRQAKFKRANKK